MKEGLTPDSRQRSAPGQERGSQSHLPPLHLQVHFCGSGVHKQLFVKLSPVFSRWPEMALNKGRNSDHASPLLKILPWLPSALKNRTPHPAGWPSPCSGFHSHPPSLCSCRPYLFAPSLSAPGALVHAVPSPGTAFSWLPSLGCLLDTGSSTQMSPSPCDSSLSLQPIVLCPTFSCVPHLP